MLMTAVVSSKALVRLLAKEKVMGISPYSRQHCATKQNTSQKKTPFPMREGRSLFSGTNLGGLVFTSPHCLLSSLLDEERGTGRRRPVAGVVDRDDGDRVISI